MGIEFAQCFGRLCAYRLTVSNTRQTVRPQLRSIYVCPRARTGILVNQRFVQSAGGSCVGFLIEEWIWMNAAGLTSPQGTQIREISECLS